MGLDRNTIKLTGRYTVKAWKRGEIDRLLSAGKSIDQAQEIAESAGFLLSEVIADNIVVSLGKDLVAKLVSGDETVGLAYFAIGTGSTPPDVSDTTLTTEVNRKTFAVIDAVSNVVTASVFFLASECTYNITEVGVFGGSTATAAADSGTLASHALQSYDNSGGAVDLTFDYELTIS